MTEKCSICQQSVNWKKLLAVKDFELQHTYQILECSSCHVKRTAPVPDLGTVYAADYFTQPQGGIYHFLKSLLIRWEIKRITRFTGSKNFMDFGAGFGDFSQQLHKLKCAVASVDATVHRPFYIRSIPEIPYLQFDHKNNEIENPSQVEGRTVVFRHVLEHIKEPHLFLEKFIHWKAAYFYIAVPNADRLEAKIFREYDGFWAPPYHLWHFTKGSLNVLLQGLNIEIMAQGHDTIPSLFLHLSFLCKAKNVNPLLCRLLLNKFTYLLLLPFNLFLPRNVLWVVGKVRQP